MTPQIKILYQDHWHHFLPPCQLPRKAYIRRHQSDSQAEPHIQ